MEKFLTLEGAAMWSFVIGVIMLFWLLGFKSKDMWRFRVMAFCFVSGFTALAVAYKDMYGLPNLGIALFLYIIFSVLARVVSGQETSLVYWVVGGIIIALGCVGIAL